MDKHARMGGELEGALSECGTHLTSSRVWVDMLGYCGHGGGRSPWRRAGASSMCALVDTTVVRRGRGHAEARQGGAGETARSLVGGGACPVLG